MSKLDANNKAILHERGPDTVDIQYAEESVLVKPKSAGHKNDVYALFTHAHTFKHIFCK